jgi:hypothetical protein
MKQVKIISQKELAEEWMRIAVQELKDNFGPAGVKSLNGPGQNSIIGHVFGVPERVSLIQIKMNKYLRYVDMGVGKGMPIGGRADLGANIFALSRNERGQLHKYKRTPKQIYSKPISHQLHRLSELMMKNFSIKTISSIEQGLDGDIKIKI